MTMPEFDVGAETITVFRIGDEYLFSHYFEREDIFEDLREYYNEDVYRFEIPADSFDEVRSDLKSEYVELDVVSDLEPYCVIKDKYTEYAPILRNSVAHWERDSQRFFLMKDEFSVNEALEHGATRLEETDYVVEL